MLRLLSMALLLSLPIAAVSDPLESVPDLEKAMYTPIESSPCVRLLNLSGEIGCSNPGRDKVVAPIVPLRYAAGLLKPSAILVPAAEMQTFLRRLSEDRSLARNVAGILVEPGPPGSSPDRKFPLAEFAPYSAPSYEWNPLGSAIMWEKYDFPVFLLSENSTAAVREMAEVNSEGADGRFENVAEFDSVMQTTQRGTRDSESCLRAQSCLPLGGYSVWSSLPPIVAGESPKKPLVLAIASMDSASFFRDRSPGADSPLSGLICLLAAADALSRIDGVHELSKRIVFAVFTGEAWGYIGSRRFLTELDEGTGAVDGLDGRLIEKVLEIGSVGKSTKGENSTFFAHFERDSSAVSDLLSALEHASGSVGGITTQRASASNPGVPPSSLMSFLRKNSSVSGVVLEEFDQAFANRFYHSHSDVIGNVEASSIAAAASLVARTLYVLAMGDHEPITSQLDAVRVNASLVEELMGCLMSCDPGFSCSLARSFISASSTCPNHYVGVFVDSPSNAEDPQNVDDTSRFIWNFLAERNSVSVQNATTCTGKCSNAGEVCVGATSDRKGKCLLSSTKYVPAYSTRLKFMNGLWHVLPANSSDSLAIIDPVWTESYWNVLGLRVYKVQSSTYDIFALLGGVTITITAYAAMLFSQAYFMKVVKHD